MKKITSLTISKPCQENWNTMSSREKGRHCLLCEKTVFDFTKQTDTNILKIVKQNENVCGRFNANQLNRSLTQKKNRSSYFSYIASGVFAFLSIGTHEVKAQQTTEVIEQATIRTNIHATIMGKVATSVLTERLFSGTVMDQDGNPLLGVMIVIKGTVSGTTTNVDGEFSLRTKKGVILEISHIGYETKEIEMIDASAYSIVLKKDHKMLLGMVIMGDVSYEESYMYSKEELRKREQIKFQTKNNKKFYDRKREEERQAKKDKKT